MCVSRVLGVEAGGGLEVNRHFGCCGCVCWFFFVVDCWFGDERYVAVLSTALCA